MGPPGYFGIPLAAKPSALKAPLWVLLIGSVLLDILTGLFLLAGWEQPGISTATLAEGVHIVKFGVIPRSHGLLMSAGWSLPAAAIVIGIWKDLASGVLSVRVVFSHWILDFIVHEPDKSLAVENSPGVDWSCGLLGQVLLSAWCWSAPC